MELNQTTERAPLPILNHENHRDWFQDMFFLLQRKEAEEAIEKPAILTPLSTTSEGSQQGLQSSQHAPARRKSNAECMYWIRKCISQDDKQLIDNENKAWRVWEILKSKYTARLKTRGRELIQEFVTYQMGDSTTINEAWAQLTRLGQEIRVTHPEGRYHYPEERLQQLLSALPDEYRFVRQTIDCQEILVVDDVLLRLREEERLNMKSSETALYAGKPRLQRSTTQPAGFACLLCDKTDHRMKDCPGLFAAKKAAQGRSGRIQKKTSPPPSKPRRRSSPKGIEDLLAMMKKMSAEIAALKKGQPAKRHKAYLAQDIDNEESVPQSPSSDGPSDGEDFETVAFNATEAKGKLSRSEWLLDSGATSHMTDQTSSFRGSLTPTRRRWIKVGGGRYLTSDFCGKAVMKDKSGNSVELNAMLVPDLGVNLVSGRKLSSEHNLFGIMLPDSFAMVDQSFKPLLHFNAKGGVYVLEGISGPLGPVQKTSKDLALFCALNAQEKTGQSDEPEQLPEKKLKQYQLFHRRFAHMGSEKLRSLHKVTTLSQPVPIVVDDTCPCEVCALTKMKNRRGKVTARKGSVLELISVDICGPIECSRNKEVYFLLIVDNHARKHWAFPMISRSQAVGHLTIWKKKVELETGLKLKAARCDNAPELVSLFKSWEREFGVAYNPTEAYNSIQNGVVERAIQTCEFNMRALLKDSGMPNEFWPEALQAAIYVLDRTATGPEIDGQVITPEEAWTGMKPSIDHIRVWGCKCYGYMNPKSLPTSSRKDKLMDRARVGVFMGYCDGTTKNFKMWAPDMKSVIVVHNLKWSENEKGGDIDLGIPTFSTSNTAPTRRPVGRPVMKLPATKLPVPVQPIRRVLQEVSIQPPPASVLKEFTPVTNPVDTEPQEPKVIQEDPEPMEVDSTSPPVLAPQQYAGAKRMRSDPDDDEEAPESKIQRAFSAMEQLIQAQDQDKPVDWALAGIEVGIKANQIPIPLTYEEAVGDPKWGHMWKDACDKEITALVANRTWDATVLLKGVNLVSSKWVFDVKGNADGSVNKFKARIVARGFSQKYGIDFEETFAPTVRHDTLRVFMAIVAQEDLECHQVDVNNAFTESALSEQIYMSPPPGVDVLPGQVLHVRRSLYGLKQAARDWNKTCLKELLKMGFIQSEADPCLLTHPARGLIILVYVDDITIAAKEISQVNWFKDTFGKAFKIKDLGEAKMILGVKVTRDRKLGTLRLDQTHYVKEVLAKLNMEKETHRPTKSPMDSYDDLKPAKPTDIRCNKTAYQEGVGRWMYLGILTRPDVAFALGRLSQFLADPTASHMSALKKLGRYIRSSQDLGILYTRSGNQTLQGYSDSDFAMDRTDRVSILGNVFMLAAGPVSWMSKKQKSVATSTMEAEYMAMCACAKQSQWLSQIMRDMGMHHLIGLEHSSPLVKENLKYALSSPMQSKPVALKGDNQAALSLVQDAHTTERSKHIDIAFHYVRMLWQKRRITVEFVGTDDMVADGFTKPKQGEPFQRFVRQLGLVMD